MNIPLLAGKFEVFRDLKGQYRFRLKAPNNEIILASEGYCNKIDCLNGIQTIKRNASNATIVDLTLVKV